MEFFNFARAAPKPCFCCNKTEYNFLQQELKKGEEDFWIYRVPVMAACKKCDTADTFPWSWLPARFTNKRNHEWFCRILITLAFYCYTIDKIDYAMKIAAFWVVAGFWIKESTRIVDIPIKASTVGIVDRAIHSASVAEKGSEYRAHGTFIKHLVGLDDPEIYKQSLTAWVPTAMMAFMLDAPGVRRTFQRGTRRSAPPEAAPQQQDKSTAAQTSATLKPEEQNENGNPDIHDGKMPATQLEGNEYGEENRVKGESIQLDPKIGAFQIGPDLIPTEVMDSTEKNLKAGLAKRVKPLPFKASASLIRKIDRTVSKMLEVIFNKEAINKWREDAHFEEMKSSKWSTQRFHHAWDEAMAETQCIIEQTFQIKQNEALPAKGKAPRPIIQCGDKAQVMMKYPVKCFEDLLFDFFEDASIKHATKHDAMGRVSRMLRQRDSKLLTHIVEGDGSAWDSCCNEKIRDLTENRIIEHIIQILGEDSEVPKAWMEEMLRDMQKSEIKGKVKANAWEITKLRVTIDSIRQSGHTGTSCFNWLINFVCWISVLSDQPWKLIGKSKGGKLFNHYRSAMDHKCYHLRYAFEGDDSAISSNENLKQHEAQIEEEWKSLGFRMKLVYVDKRLTFTGFDFLCNKDGPTGDYIPELARNIASSSWSCSSELKMRPEKLHQIGAAAMLARAENFKDCGPFSRYFAALGLAHARRIRDFGLGEQEAKSLGIQVSPSVKDALQVLYDSADLMEKGVREIVETHCKLSHEDELRLLACDFGTDPFNAQMARELIPIELWDPSKFEKARR